MTTRLYWNVTPCILVEKDQRFRGSLLPWRQRQQIYPESCYVFAEWQGITSQNTTLCIKLRCFICVYNTRDNGYVFIMSPHIFTLRPPELPKSAGLHYLLNFWREFSRKTYRILTRQSTVLEKSKVAQLFTILEGLLKNSKGHYSVEKNLPLATAWELQRK